MPYTCILFVIIIIRMRLNELKNRILLCVCSFLDLVVLKLIFFHAQRIILICVRNYVDYNIRTFVGSVL